MIQDKVFITPDDYFEYFGDDLREVLGARSNESHEAERFIARVTDHLKQWIDSNTFRVQNYDFLTGYQLSQFQKAILNQCYYTINEGVKVLGLSSGIDDERGIVIPVSALREMKICDAALDCLKNAGLFNLVMKNRPRTLQGYPEYDFYDPEVVLNRRK